MKILTILLPLLLIATSPALARGFDLPSALVKENLTRLQLEETQGRSAVDVEVMNRNSFRVLQSVRTRATVKAYDIANLIRSYNYHPVIGPKAVEAYQQTGVSIGYCFGRAYYFHRALMTLGVPDEAIMKAWIVGKIGTNWQFHVATMVRGEDGNWWVMDTVRGSWGRGVRIQDWYLYWKSKSSDSTRIYFTRAQKFTPALASYNPIQLGYGLDRENDWYKNYFIDLDKWMDGPSALPFFRKLGVSPVGPRRLGFGAGGLW